MQPPVDFNGDGGAFVVKMLNVCNLVLRRRAVVVVNPVGVDVERIPREHIGGDHVFMKRQNRSHTPNIELLECLFGTPKCRIPVGAPHHELCHERVVVGGDGGAGSHPAINTDTRPGRNSELRDRAR